MSELQPRKAARASVWTAFHSNLFESMLGLLLLSLLYGWNIWPRWMMLVIAWAALALGLASAVIGGLWLLFGEQS